LAYAAGVDLRPGIDKLDALARTYAVVPVWREILCDGDTPVGAFAKLRDLDPTRYLLESVVGGQRWARYSFVGLGHRARVVGTATANGFEVSIEPGPGFSLSDLRGSGVAKIEALLAALHGPSVPELGRFWGGLVGVWGHDLVRAFEHLPIPANRPASDLPAIDLLASDTLLVFDDFAQKLLVVTTLCPETDGGLARGYALAGQRIERVVERLRAEPRLSPLELVENAGWELVPAPPFSRAGLMDNVERGKAYIRAGDVFQVVLSQRFDEQRAGLDPFDVYRLLRITNPAPYMYLLELPSATLAGASPEVLVRVDHDPRRVTVRPIAGTRPRGIHPDGDARLERELLADPKERAEHLMLIDLGRNDVGRVSVPGSVRVDESFKIERYSQVMHIVSEVSGQLLPGMTALDALRATFPAGTLSGAPKLRALELIDELEPAPRGWYGGAVGYLGYDGAADFAICIRSLVVTRDSVRIQAGGGIVHDSEPHAEDRESRNKAAAVARAVAMARKARAYESGVP